MARYIYHGQQCEKKKNCIVNVERAWVASIIVSMMLQLL